MGCFGFPKPPMLPRIAPARESRVASACQARMRREVRPLMDRGGLVPFLGRLNGERKVSHQDTCGRAPRVRGVRWPDILDRRVVVLGHLFLCFNDYDCNHGRPCLTMPSNQPAKSSKLYQATLTSTFWHRLYILKVGKPLDWVCAGWFKGL